MATTAFSISRRATTIAASSALALGGVFVLTTAAPAQAQVMKNGDKVWVCKYVGKPGVDERLKAGKNPIEVGWRSADKDKNGQVSVGDEFADAQGRSIVIQINGTDPGIKKCPPPVGPPTTTTTTSPTETTSTTAPPTETTTTTTPGTTTTTPGKTTTSTGTATTTPAGPSTTTPSGGAGGGVTPGVGAPNTGGAGEGNPVNGLIGSGLLLSAAGLLAFDTLKRRRNSTVKQD